MTPRMKGHSTLVGAIREGALWVLRPIAGGGEKSDIFLIAKGAGSYCT